MSTEPHVEFRYHPNYCTVMRKSVWAIVTRQPDGTWRIVNCLDKDDACFKCNCAFTVDHGQWPYETPAGPIARPLVHPPNTSPAAS